MSGTFIRCTHCDARFSEQSVLRLHRRGSMCGSPKAMELRGAWQGHFGVWWTSKSVQEHNGRLSLKPRVISSSNADKNGGSVLPHQQGDLSGLNPPKPAMTCLCGASLQHRRKGAKYCSERCRKRAARAQNIPPAGGLGETNVSSTQHLNESGVTA